MSFNQSRFSGEFGFSGPGFQAVRLVKSEHTPLNGIVIDRSQLPETPLEHWGFQTPTASDTSIELAELGLSSDLRSRYDVDFFDDGQRVGGFVFEDSHPDPWWDAVHKERRLFLVVGDVTALIKAKTQAEQLDVINNSARGISPLAIRGYDSGVGTSAPGQ